MTTALVMAGGQGQRMHASGGVRPKPLVAVRGVPLLERNMTRLLSAGFRDVTVAVAADGAEIRQFVETRGRALGRAFGAAVTVLEERMPLGNIGAARCLPDRGGDVLVVYADNLTAVDLEAVVRRHHETDAALTTAVHEEVFAFPFGAVDVIAGRVLRYREKPASRVLISSGIYVVGARAIAAIPPGRRTEVAGLVNDLLAAGAPVAAFCHEAPWVDVNDLAAARRAEALVAAHLTAFERWDPAPGAHEARVLACTAEAILLERRFAERGSEPTWDLPRVCPRPDDGFARALRRYVEANPGPAPEADFDDLDPTSGRRVRYRVFVARPPRPVPGAVGNRVWWPRAQLPSLPGVSSIVRRALAALASA